MNGKELVKEIRKSRDEIHPTKTHHQTNPRAHKKARKEKRQSYSLEKGENIASETTIGKYKTNSSDSNKKNQGFLSCLRKRHQNLKETCLCKSESRKKHKNVA
jgi:hypothetical protein